MQSGSGGAVGSEWVKMLAEVVLVNVWDVLCTLLPSSPCTAADAQGIAHKCAVRRHCAFSAEFSPHKEGAHISAGIGRLIANTQCESDFNVLCRL